MMRPKKKLEGVDAQTAVTVAARKTLEARLTFVAEMLDLAGRSGDDDARAEHIHQLRVSTRRAVAAIDAYEACLRGDSGKLKKKARRMRKLLKRIRRTAGEARDCDVHLLLFASMQEKAEDDTVAAIEDLIRHTGGRRAKALKRVVKMRKKHPRRKLIRGAVGLVELLSPPRGEGGREPSLIEHAREALPALERSVQEAAAADLSDLDNLHGLRIGLKRLRYAVEIFTPCFEKQARKSFLAMLKSIQDHLGIVNDRDAVIARIERRIGDVSDHGDAELVSGLRLLADSQRFDRDRRRDDFLAWWREFDRADFFASLDRMLESADVPEGGAGSASESRGRTTPAAAIGATVRSGVPREREHSP